MFERKHKLTAAQGNWKNIYEKSINTKIGPEKTNDSGNTLRFSTSPVLDLVSVELEVEGPAKLTNFNFISAEFISGVKSIRVDRLEQTTRSIGDSVFLEFTACDEQYSVASHIIALYVWSFESTKSLMFISSTVFILLFASLYVGSSANLPALPQLGFSSLLLFVLAVLVRVDKIPVAKWLSSYTKLAGHFLKEKLGFAPLLWLHYFGGMVAFVLVSLYSVHYIDRTRFNMSVSNVTAQMFRDETVVLLQDNLRNLLAMYPDRPESWILVKAHEDYLHGTSPAESSRFLRDVLDTDLYDDANGNGKLDSGEAYSPDVIAKSAKRYCEKEFEFPRLSRRLPAFPSFGNRNRVSITKNSACAWSLQLVFNMFRDLAPLGDKTDNVSKRQVREVNALSLRIQSEYSKQITSEANLAKLIPKIHEYSKSIRTSIPSADELKELMLSYQERGDKGAPRRSALYHFAMNYVFNITALACSLSDESERDSYRNLIKNIAEQIIPLLTQTSAVEISRLSTAGPRKVAFLVWGFELVSKDDWNSSQKIFFGHFKACLGDPSSWVAKTAYADIDKLALYKSYLGVSVPPAQDTLTSRLSDFSTVGWKL